MSQFAANPSDNLEDEPVGRYRTLVTIGVVGLLTFAISLTLAVRFGGSGELISATQTWNLDPASITTSPVAPTTLATTTSTSTSTTTTVRQTTTSATQPTTAANKPVSVQPQSTTILEPTSTARVPSGGPTPLQWQTLRKCESGDNYTIVSRNGLYYGAYQFSIPTWKGVAERAGRSDLINVLPSRASVIDQDLMARHLYSERGDQPWPHCGKHLR